MEAQQDFRQRFLDLGRPIQNIHIIILSLIIRSFC